VSGAGERVVLVTGGGAGMGRAIAQRFHGAGDRVAILEFDGERIAETSELLGGKERFLGIEGDVASAQDTERAVGETVARFGRLDVVCNNAGVLGEGLVHETSLETWNRVIGVNLTGMFLVCRAAIPHMLDQGKGVFVNTASSSAFVGGGGDAAYTASKHGVVGLTRQLAVEYAKQGIRANALCPGATATPMTAPNRGPDGPYDEFIASTPAGRWARPEEMANLAFYLASDEADFVHGAAWCIDGGWTAF
jgi:NAD(P)-dependent dehydrogenase (short-subunit alcohol dehydrogenase family)